MKAFKLSVLVASFLFLGLGLFLKIGNTTGSLEPSGIVAGSQTSLWSSLPSDLPIPLQATLISTLQKSGALEVTLETSTTPLVIEKFYKENLSAKGWQPQNDGFFKEGKKLSWQITQNISKTQSVIILNYVFDPTR